MSATFLCTKIRRSNWGDIACMLELLQFFKIHPWLDPDLSFIQLLFTSIDNLNSKMVQCTSYYLLLRLHHSHKLKKWILQRDRKIITLYSGITRVTSIRCYYSRMKWGHRNRRNSQLQNDYEYPDSNAWNSLQRFVKEKLLSWLWKKNPLNWYKIST